MTVTCTKCGEDYKPNFTHRCGEYRTPNTPGGGGQGQMSYSNEFYQCDVCGLVLKTDDTHNCPGVIEEQVNHPKHYGGVDNLYEAIKVIEAWGLGFCLGNTVKYICREGSKHADGVEDLKKAAWYLNREIERRESDKERN